MNRLTAEDRTRILQLLCEGMSVRAVIRVIGASKNTVVKLLTDAGKACWTYHNEHVRNLTAKRIQCDEIWSFTYAKQKNGPTAKEAPEGAGDTWTWTAIDADNKLVVSWLVGSRDSEYAVAFMDDLRGRLVNHVQLTTDGHRAYLEDVEGAFGDDIDYAMLLKLYGQAPEVQCCYSPPECIEARKARIEGKPNKDDVNKSYVERQNVTMQMRMRRFTRLTNGFSKKVENHEFNVALHFMYYNFVRVHSSLRCTPAMAAGVTDRLWEVSDIVALVETAEAKQPRKRGPYKKRAS